jgi:hypothetical protein
MTNSTTTSKPRVRPNGPKPETVIPEDVKQPQDHKPTAEERLEEALSADELLADLPELKAPEKLRIRDRNKVYTILLGSGLIDDDGDVDLGDAEDKKLDFEKVTKTFEMAAQVDEFAESIAKDPDAYIAWSEGKGHEVFFALLTRYASAVGESAGS